MGSEQGFVGRYSYDTFPIDGHVMWRDGSKWSLEQDRNFMVAFQDWLGQQGLSFGGTLGNPTPKGGVEPLEGNE